MLTERLPCICTARFFRPLVPLFAIAQVACQVMSMISTLFCHHLIAHKLKGLTNLPQRCRILSSSYLFHYYINFPRRWRQILNICRERLDYGLRNATPSDAARKVKAQRTNKDDTLRGKSMKSYLDKARFNDELNTSDMY